MDTNDARESSVQQNDGVKSPLNQLLTIASEQGYALEDLEFARYMDKHDTLANLRNEFYYPKMKDLDSVDLSLVDQEDDCVYFCGSSFGLCPKKTMEYMNEEIEKWQRSGYKGFITGTLPWAICDECLQDDIGKLVGAREGECALMNGLTVNLHLFLISFYNPTPARYKILIEANTFSSDRYVMESQIRLRGYDPSTALLILKPRQGEYILRNEDILSVIEEKGESIATICLSGVQFYTGQKFNIPAITRAGHKKGCYVGWDLAHAAGNVELFLHDWDVDFACWCTNKYLNCGPGSLGGVFLHEKHFNSNLPQLQGWWGHNIKTRFDTDTCFDPCHGALRYRLSTTPGFLCPPIKASLEVFGKTTVSTLATKSRLLTTYLEERILQKFGCRESASTNIPNAKDDNSLRTLRKVGLDESTKAQIEIITPTDSEHRGAQLSLLLSIDTSVVHDELTKRGVLCDERKPNVLRVTPAPIYCSFEDVHRFVKYLGEALDEAKVAKH